MRKSIKTRNSFPRSCVGTHTELMGKCGMDSHAGAWEPDTKTLVPKLRFPEFRDAGTWEDNNFYNLLEEVLDFRGRTPKKLGMDWGGGNIVSLSANNVKNGYIDFDAECNLGSSVLYEKWMGKVDLEKNDIVFTMEAPLGKALLVPDSQKYILSQRVVAFKTKRHVNNGFLIQLIWSQLFQNIIGLLSTGSTAKGINQKTLKTVHVRIPSEENEQQRIANCLSSIDELITAHSQKHEALKAHKKGLMQQLFPAQGDDCMDAGGRAMQDAKAGTIPKLRFPEFQNAGEWNVRPLKKVFSIFQGFAFSSKDSVTEGVRWLKIADVSIQQMNHSTPSYLPIKHREKYDRFSVKQGGYVLALTRPILSNQLKIAPVDEVFHGALLNQRVGKLITTENIAFVYFLLQTSQLISDIKKSISGSEPPNLSAQQIENIKTYIPSNKEQQKIADCLSSIDDLITGQAKKIELLKVHKKGLMQQLFPCADGVNG